MYDVPYVLDAHSHVYGKSLHLGVCGSIAAFRALDLVRWWKKTGIHVSTTLTDSCQRFVTPLSFEALGAHPIYTSMWNDEQIFGHLEPGQNCHVMVIAPASASTLAHLAHGNADSMLACQALAFDGTLIVAPSMNPRMWNNKATQQNIKILQDRGVIVIHPDSGSTACGDSGQGRLADLRYIWLMSLKALTEQDMKGKKVLITLGPTREKWDAVRFWSNPSTGTMGTALAISAWLRGAHVHAVCGPITENAGYFPSHPHMQRYDVESAEEMFNTASDIWYNVENKIDMGIFTAAVADYRPKPHENGYANKFKKSTAHAGLCIEFSANKDILLTLAKDKHPHQRILGFAAETAHSKDIEQIHTHMQNAVRYKLQQKNTDLLAGNNLCAEDSGFATSTNAMYVADKNGREEIWPTLSKFDVAWRLCTWLMQI